MNKKTDAELFQLMANGCLASFDEIYSRYYDKCSRLALRMTRREIDAEDVLQNTFLAIWKSKGKFQFKSSVGSWIYRITANEALMLLRKRKIDREDLLEELGEYVDYPLIADPFLRYTINEAAGMIENKQQRAAVVLYRSQELTHKEAATATAQKLGSIKSQILRGNEALRKHLKWTYEEWKAAA